MQIVLIYLHINIFHSPENGHFCLEDGPENLSIITVMSHDMTHMTIIH